MEHAIAALAAWKLGLSGIEPTSKVRLTSTNDKSRYTQGTSAQFDAISGHRDGFATNCPGEALLARLPAIRKLAAASRTDPHEHPSVRAFPPSSKTSATSGDFPAVIPPMRPSLDYGLPGSRPVFGKQCDPSRVGRVMSRATGTRFCGRTLVVTQTVLIEQYWQEIHSTLAR